VIDDGDLEAKVKAISFPGADKVLELVGTSTLKNSLACVAPGGIVCMTGMLAEQWSITNFSPMEYIPATISLTIYDSGQIRVDQQSFQEFISDVETGEIKLNIGRSFPFQEIALAHKLMDDNLAGGKIVVLT
jgi:NADPH2:quinone reductase